MDSFLDLRKWCEEKYDKASDNIIKMEKDPLYCDWKRGYERGQKDILGDILNILCDYEKTHTQVAKPTEKNPVITIIGSLSQTDLIIRLEDGLKYIFPDATIYSPVNEQEESLLETHWKYINHIKESTFVIVVPKEESVDRDEEQPSMSWHYKYGESTTYEIATAIQHHIPIYVAPTFEAAN